MNKIICWFFAISLALILAHEIWLGAAECDMREEKLGLQKLMEERTRQELRDLKEQVSNIPDPNRMDKILNPYPEADLKLNFERDGDRIVPQLKEK